MDGMRIPNASTRHAVRFGTKRDVLVDGVVAGMLSQSGLLHSGLITEDIGASANIRTLSPTAARSGPCVRT